jgi:predicted RND superfamily exporter protein
MAPQQPSWPAAYCRFVARRSAFILTVAVGVFVLAAALASRLELRTAFHELLPSNDPGVVALMRTQNRIPDLSLLLIGVRSPDREANLRYAETLTQKLRSLPPSVVTLATYEVKDLKRFFEHNKWMYVSEPDLENIRDRLRREITKRKNPLLVDLSEDEETVEGMRDRLTKKDTLGGRFKDGVFSDNDGTSLWIAALPPGGIFGEHTGAELYQAALKLVKETDPHPYHPQMTVAVMGPVATAVIARQAVERDILWVTITCAIVVALSILLYFRRLRSVPLIGIPAVMGTVMAFAVAKLAFGYVNSSTAFLGSIILGNGINYAIILLARYQEERASGVAASDALERAVGGVATGTGVAAVCASAAYATLTLTSFRGFFQFGVMGACGVLFCWVATFTVMPALFFLLDRRAPVVAGGAPASLWGVARLVERRAPLILTLSVAATFLSSRGLIHFTQAPFEYDFRKLNVRTSSNEQNAQFTKEQDRLFGRWPQPYIVLADRPEDVEPIRQAIRKQDAAHPGPPLIGHIVTLHDVLPGLPEVQQRKLALIAQVRKLVHDPSLEAASEEDRKKIQSIDIPDDLRVVTIDDLPPLARRPFTERDGSVGRVILVYFVEEGISVWNGKDLMRIASVLQEIHLPDGRTLMTSGSAVVFSAMIRSILRDGRIATAASLVVVVLLAFLFMRPVSAAAMAIGSLLVGVLWMIGAAGWAEVKITFLNFIALPITFGIGAEYALNVVSRYQQGRDIGRAVASTGSAVALCSWTTIVGYGSLLAARNRALQGFGAMAILGEIACLTAAIVGLPSLILWLQQRRQAKSERDLA